MNEEQEILFSQIKTDAENLRIKIGEYVDENIGDIDPNDYGNLAYINNSLCKFLGIDY